MLHPFTRDTFEAVFNHLKGKSKYNFFLLQFFLLSNGEETITIETKNLGIENRNTQSQLLREDLSSKRT